MKRRANSELLFQVVICFILSALFVYALISRKASNYVHPRLYGFLWFAAAALFAIAVFMLRFSFTPKHNARPLKNILLIVPMITAVIIPVGVVQSQAISFGTSAGRTQNASSFAQSCVSSQDKGVVIPDSASSEDDIGIDTSTSPSSPAPQEDKNGVMTISDEQFANWYTDINENMKKYEGKTLKMKGQVFRMSTFAKNEIVPARYAMVCCAADLQPCGILCRSDEVSQYKDNDWVWVTGKIKIENYQKQTMPVCYVTKIEKADKAKEDYIYFTY